MNEHVTIERTAERLEPRLPTTRAAEGLPRYRWTRAKIEAAVEAGIFHDDDRFELIGGEIVPMSPKGLNHERLKRALNRDIRSKLPDAIDYLPETTLWVGDDQFVEPDFLFFPREVETANIQASVCLLGIEVAGSSLPYDRGRKRRIYAAAGLPHYWVIDAETLKTYHFSALANGDYTQETIIEPMEVLAPDFAPEFRITLGALDIR